MDLILTDIQILCILMCTALSFVSYKVRMPAIAVIPAIGFFILGFEIYSASQDLLILALFFMAAVVQFLVCFRSSGR